MTYNFHVVLVMHAFFAETESWSVIMPVCIHIKNNSQGLPPCRLLSPYFLAQTVGLNLLNSSSSTFYLLVIIITYYRLAIIVLIKQSSY